MAGSNSSSTPTVRSVTSALSEIEEFVAGDSEESMGVVYALDDLGRHCDKTPFSSYTMRRAVEALARQLYERAAYWRQRLPADHPAAVRARELQTALVALDSFMFNSEHDTGRFKFSRRVVGRALLVLAIEVGRCVERVTKACSKEPSTGYLSGEIGAEGGAPNPGPAIYEMEVEEAGSLAEHHVEAATGSRG